MFIWAVTLTAREAAKHTSPPYLRIRTLNTQSVEGYVVWHTEVQSSSLTNLTKPFKICSAYYIHERVFVQRDEKHGTNMRCHAILV